MVKVADEKLRPLKVEINYLKQERTRLRLRQLRGQEPFDEEQVKTCADRILNLKSNVQECKDSSAWRAAWRAHQLECGMLDVNKMNVEELKAKLEEKQRIVTALQILQSTNPGDKTFIAQQLHSHADVVTRLQTHLKRHGAQSNVRE
jgi:hypothetical protein